MQNGKQAIPGWRKKARILWEEGGVQGAQQGAAGKSPALHQEESCRPHRGRWEDSRAKSKDAQEATQCLRVARNSPVKCDSFTECPMGLQKVTKFPIVPSCHSQGLRPRASLPGTMVVPQN